MKNKAKQINNADNENIKFVSEYLAKKNEPYILFFSANSNGNLQMAMHGMTIDHVKETLQIALDGIIGGLEIKTTLHS